MIDNERPENAPPEGQEHLGPTKDAALNGIPDEISIEIAPETPEEGAEPVAEQPRQPALKRPRNDPQRRIDQATARQRQAETAAEQLSRENKELLAKLEGGNKATETLTERAETAERAALLHHKRAQTLELDAAKRDYQAAIESGQADKQTDAAARISAAQGALGKITDWEAQHPAPQPGDKPAERAPEPRREEPRAEQRPAPQLAAPAKAFIEENSAWFHENGADYDQSMRDELVNYANSYERRLAGQGKQAEINTEPYFDKLRQHMRNEFPDYDWGDGDESVIPARDALNVPPTRQAAQRPNGRMPQMTRDNAVLPANGQAAPGAKSAQNVRVSMSDAEKELAIGQWENGVTGNHWKTGKPIANREQAVDQWAFQKLPPEAKQRALAGRR